MSLLLVNHNDLNSKQLIPFLDKLIALSLFLLLFTDTVTGFIVNEGLNFLRPSQVLKLVIIGYMTFRLCLIQKYFVLLVFFYLAWIIASLSSYYLHAYSIGFIARDVNFLIKTFLPLISFYFCKFLLQKNEKYYSKYFQYILYFNFIILAGNMILGIMGFGYSEYTIGDKEIGTSGYFTAGNEVAAVMVILNCFVLFKCWANKRKYYLLLAALCFFIAVCKATKVAMLGSLLSIIFIPLVSEHLYIFKFTKLKLWIMVSFFLALFLSFNLGVYLIDEIGLMDRWAFALAKTDLLTTILSGRNIYLENAWYLFKNDFSTLEMFFGRGLDNFVKSMIPYIGKEKNVEMDFFDIFFQYGILGTILVFVPYLKIIYETSLKFFNGNKYFAPMVLLSNAILLLVSFISGHVIGGGMVAVFIGIVNSMAYIDKKTID